MTTVETANHLPKVEFWNATVIRETAEEVLGDAKGTTKKLVAALVDAFRKEKDLADCDKCGGQSSASLPRCPFCGDADVEEVQAVAEETKKKALVRKEKAEVEKTPKVSQADYKSAYKQVLAHKAALCKDFWELGLLCSDIREKRLWLGCIDEESKKPAYKSFDAWLVDEAGLTKTYIYGLMDLVKSFTEEHVKKFGKSHMLALTSVEPADRPFLVSELEKREMSYPEFNKLVQQTKAARKTTKINPKGAPKERTKVPLSEVATPQAITAVFPLERVELEMFARIQSGEQTKPATDFSEQPWSKMSLTNGVDVFFGLAKRADGQFVLTVQAIRNDT